MSSLSEALKRDLKHNQVTIDKLMVSKADKKSQAVAIEKINAAITLLEKELLKLNALKQDLKTVSSSITKLENKLTNQLEALSTDTRQQGENYEQLQVSLTDLSDKAVDKDMPPANGI